jgi:threonylcarbamoyladenosine tRNA methylthiotransferase MtaB
MKRVIVTTLGCKVNQCESAAIGSHLAAAGFEPATQDQAADLVVINTCTVTGKAAMQSRQAIRQAMRQHPGAKIVVTGCYAQTAPEEIQSIDGVSIIVGHADKLRIADILTRDASTAPPTQLIHQAALLPHDFAAMPSVAPDGRTRAFLKIQDGCNAYCTYCIVPHARGRSRSMPVADVKAHLQTLGAAGHREVVLTGIHLGAFGKDFDPPLSLVHLLDQMIPACPVDRLRLSSIEPTEINDRILDLMAESHTPLCPHLHIPLQSGDNRILKQMGRPYCRERFRHTIQTVKNRLPQAAIGVDVLVGFPGESDVAFKQTVDLIQELPVTYLHVFPFSTRKGTPAADFKDKIPETIITARCRRLRRLGEEKRTAFYNSQIGQRVEVLVETTRDAVSGRPKGHSANYLPVVVAHNQVAANTIVSVQIEGLDKQGYLIGRMLSG